jgi:anti-anti-sigma factor
MDIREEKTKQGTVLKLTRSLDRTNCPQLDRSMEKLFGRRKEAVWIDVSGLTSIDSAGLTLFLKWHRRALHEGRRFAFVNSAEYHRKLFEITRLDQELVVFDTPSGERIRPRPARGLAWRTKERATSDSELTST